MKRIVLISLALLCTALSYIHAVNILEWNADVTQIEDKQKVYIPGGGKSMPENCAVLRVNISPRIPEEFNFRECTNETGRDIEELRKPVREQNYILFFFNVKKGSPIRRLQFIADGYKKVEKTSLNIEPNGRYETTIEVKQEDWLLFKLRTNVPNCEIIRGFKSLGHSDENGYFEAQVRMPAEGDALMLKAAKEGYVPAKKQIIIEKLPANAFDKKNMIITYNEVFELVKEGSEIQETVTFVSHQEGTYKLLYTSDYQDSLEVKTNSIKLKAGSYLLEVSKPGFTSITIPFKVEIGKAQSVQIDVLEELKGLIKIQSKPGGADVLVDGKRVGSTTAKEGIPVGIGQHTLVLHKDKYVNSDPLTFTIKNEEDVYEKNIELFKTKNEWWSSSQYFPHHYLETYYGMGITANKDINHYIGLQYTVIPHTIGANMSLMYGFNNRDIVATVGPALTLTTQRKTDLDLQLMLGAGYANLLRAYGYPRVGTWVLEAGLRFGFENAITGYRFSWWSIYMGAKYYDKKVVPTLGISLMPFGLFALGADYFTDETDHSSFFFEPTVGYAVKSRDCMIGATFAWQGYNTGFYTSFAYGVLEGNISAIAGPAFHLTPDLDVFDLTLYGGIGYGHTANGDHCLAGDFGLRFGFSHSDFSWWDVTLGCTSFGGEWVPSIGISWGLVGTIATAGVGAIFYNY